MTFNKIFIEALINETPNTVWDKWTSPNHITQWNFASDDWCCPMAENDLKVGGKYVARMEAKDGRFGFDFGGVYTEMIPNKKITLKLGDGREASTEFEAFGNQTKVSTVFDAEALNPEEMQRNGWQAILDNFKRYVEATAA